MIDDVAIPISIELLEVQCQCGRRSWRDPTNVTQACVACHGQCEPTGRFQVRGMLAYDGKYRANGNGGPSLIQSVDFSEIYASPLNH